MQDEIKNELVAELLCVADTDWVLGHWYIKVMLNGRSLTDCSSFAGMGQEALGHTRAIFKFLEDELDLPEHQLEFGRDRTHIHDMEMLSKPPENWGDFLVTTFLAEGAVWNMLSTFRSGSEPGISGMVTHFGKELYFHRLAIEGWLKSATDEDRVDMVEAASHRVPLALRWFDTAERSDNDDLLKTGVRSSSVNEAKTAFIASTLVKLNETIELAEMPDAEFDEWDPVRRRTRDSGLPVTLWEFMIPSDPDTVKLRRPLAVSVDDNLDLFDRPEYAQDD